MDYPPTSDGSFQRGATATVYDAQENHCRVDISDVTLNTDNVTPRPGSAASVFSEGKFAAVTLNRTVEDLENWYSKDQQVDLEKGQMNQSLEMPDLEEEGLEKARRDKFESSMRKMFHVH